MDIITFINSLTNEDFNRIRNSKSDAEARRLLREHQALQLQQTGVIRWLSTDEELPICYSTGNWDGKKSDLFLAETITGKKFIAQCYEGFMDGFAFFDWYQVDEVNQNDWLITEPVRRWMKIPF